MLKRLVSLLLAFALLFSASALANDYSGSQENEATFETLTEARLNAPEAIAHLEMNEGNVYGPHPVLDDYPCDSTYVYRSANMYGGRAAARLNTNIVVYTEDTFESKDEAFEYLQGLGLIDIIDEAIGSVVLVTPAMPVDADSSGNRIGGFGLADQQNYYRLQTAMFSQKAGGNADGTIDPPSDTDLWKSYEVYYPEGEYFGGYGYYYLIGIDGGATFLNNYVAGTFDYISRVAGMLLIGGKMDRIRQVATFVPTYLVNAPEDVVEKYKAANATDTNNVYHGVKIFKNQAQPLQQVWTVETENVDAAAIVKDAYYNLFIKAMRLPVMKKALNSAPGLYQSTYNYDQAPFSLCERNAVINGRTSDGIIVTRVDDYETFADLTTSPEPSNVFGMFVPGSQYLQTWFEYIPEEVLDGTAPEHSVPLILTNHGGSDDPRLFVDENGWLALAGKERFAMVAAEHQNIAELRDTVLPMLVEYMLDKYPALDPSRVYVTGYSMGSGATFSCLFGKGKLFAAAVPMAAASGNPTEEQAAQYDAIDIPVLLLTSEYDLSANFNQPENIISTTYQDAINMFLGWNEMPQIEYDFDKYPLSGINADQYYEKVLNNEYKNYTWFLENDAGVPMVGLTYTECLIHALYPEYAKIAWNYMKHFSRNPETLEITYNPYVD